MLHPVLACKHSIRRLARKRNVFRVRLGPGRNRRGCAPGHRLVNTCRPPCRESSRSRQRLSLLWNHTVSVSSETARYVAVYLLFFRPDRILRTKIIKALPGHDVGQIV